MNSEHFYFGSPKMAVKPDRFDPWIEYYNARKPAPASYAPKNTLTSKKSRAYVKQHTVRMKPDRYNTDAPGPGAYRMQTEFGVYSPDDIQNTVDPNDIQTVVANTVKNRPSFLNHASPSKYTRNLLSLNEPLHSSAGFSTISTIFKNKKDSNHAKTRSTQALERIYVGATPQVKRKLRMITNG